MSNYLLYVQTMTQMSHLELTQSQSCYGDNKIDGSPRASSAVCTKDDDDDEILVRGETHALIDGSTVESASMATVVGPSPWPLPGEREIHTYKYIVYILDLDDFISYSEYV
jgi:hypothetical protein